jgi:hypothetical protein
MLPGSSGPLPRSLDSPLDTRFETMRRPINASGLSEGLIRLRDRRAVQLTAAHFSPAT